MSFAFGHWGLSPAEFWAATPRELASAMRPLHAASDAPLDRNTLAALMATHPDGKNQRDG